MSEKSHERDSVCIDVRVLGVESIVRYFLGIVGILEFYVFVIFSSCHKTLIFQSCTLCFQE